ncbi:transporter substrate-binding domain-containing protein [Desulfomicrobium baculatum]|uniref:Extracellular solute-binding protein family 3 n=1 Tax=Desulfomicrobium baculatum (strain DSM 4028 / VKM B-1378 / X) TaxID=525897 RepID=C7LSC6_DESBD|nr:transporter substrate-binding domain-containing protein [Desulfomicrobium baculatum]ACU90674.1 extracellular solute-binding protein family 3 [Desulfomicrobium baculatum DSM 4028]
MYRITAILIVCLSLSAGFMPRESSAAEKSVLDQVMERGVLRVGFDTFVPWAMKDKNGDYIGFEIDVARKVAADMGVEIELVPTKWSGIIPALLTGKFDIIIGGMGIQPSRNLKVNFSSPYEFSGMSLVASIAAAPNLSSLDDFNKPEIILSAKTGASSVAAAKKHIPKATVRMFDDEAQALQEVLNGRAHAMVASAPFPEQQAIRNKDTLYLPLQGETFAQEPIGFAVRKGDHDFLNFLNNWVLVAGTEGWLAERYAYWFKTMDWETQIK